jgi:hypothetical protein
MAVEPEPIINSPCPVNPEIECTIPCIQAVINRDNFYRNAQYLEKSPDELRLELIKASKLPGARIVMMDDLKNSGVYDRCGAVMFGQLQNERQE